MEQENKPAEDKKEMKSNRWNIMWVKASDS